ncbi:hypothetical protein HYPSUDRAFT_212284 [Hypholoma sublateritium FD-334 SS-4]|uniref:Ams2/SPT21 N-terminal domain-containing protein n=1 Tax=Hypholoma sublateritium (strain FD-334 SS-4) TaxID=945553 RepID=A0A0D2PGS9_HYPSF|nr:hypothetical protein HYPSUDRAFT_212284 [Hypholoma sublateritium FD-334 SS-4]
MPVEKKTVLRVLYTINSSPQYILARSQNRVQISVIPSSEHESSSDALNISPPIYGSVSLKTCLDTVFRSSPELAHDSARDFSLYVLDPLESRSAPAPVHINASEDALSAKGGALGVEQTRGVAVGLGLMSWALSADESDMMPVVGTLVKQTNGQEALEVVFSLRETMAMPRQEWSMPPPALPSSSQDSASSAAESSSSRPESKHQPWYSNQAMATSSAAQPSSEHLTRETLASIQSRAKPKSKPPKSVRQSTVPVTESDKLMSADTFIGPMKKKGRPKTTNTDMKPLSLYSTTPVSSSSFSSNAKEIIVIDGSDSDGTGATPTTSSFQIPVNGKAPATRPGPQDMKRKKTNYSQYPKTPAFTTEPLVRRTSEQPKPVVQQTQPTQVKCEPQDEPSLLDILAFFTATSSSDPAAQNAAILAALGTIDSSNSQENSAPAAPANPALISALKKLLTIYANAPPANTPSNPPTPPSSQPSSQPQPRHPQSQDDDIVILDKENVNPKAHQTPTGKDAKAAKLSDSPVSASVAQANAIAGPSSHADRSALQSLGPSARLNEHSSPRTTLNESSRAPRNDRVVRKRTLSEFMDEKEGGRSKGKGKERERERVEKRDGHRHASAQRPPASDGLRHYPRLFAPAQPRPDAPANNYYRTALECMSSPGRSRSESVDDGMRHLQTSSSSGGSRTRPPSRAPSPKQRISASSPVRGLNHERKKYVVPEWARTGTAMQPRLSEEAQRALEELEEKKKLERAAARRRLPSMQSRAKTKSARPSSADGSHATENEPARPRPLAPSAATMPSSDRPLVAASNVNFPFMLTRSSSPPPNPRVVPRTPKTPVRDRHHMRFTPGQENESLFTPIVRSGSLFGSANSRTLHTPLQGILTSPLGNRKKAKLTPARSLVSGKPSSTPISWKLSSLQSSEDSKMLEEEQTLSLERELEEAMDDLDCPPSSLPIASSDIDVDEDHTSNDPDATIGLDQEDIEISPVKQHWQGLPPSSPPPPSSPMLLPAVYDDEEMDELPVATPDSETDTDMTPCGSDATAESPASLDEQLADALATGDFASFFPPAEGAGPGSAGLMDIFDQFTHLNSDPTESEGFGALDGGGDGTLGAMFENGLDGIDFTEFWETFKPLVNDSTQFAAHEHGGASGGALFDMTKEEGEFSQFAEIDHVKLADDMQALLSGCLM